MGPEFGWAPVTSPILGKIGGMVETSRILPIRPNIIIHLTSCLMLKPVSEQCKEELELSCQS